MHKERAKKCYKRAPAVTLFCWRCGRAFEARRRHATTCSRACRVARHRGQRDPRSVRLARRWGLKPSDFWRTPPWLVAALLSEFPLTLDVSAAADDRVLPLHIGPGEDGRFVDWLARALGGACWFNPPYSPGLLPWVEKAAAESARGIASVGLVPPATGSRYMALADKTAAEVRLIRGRVPFLHPDTGKAAAGNRGDSCLIIFDGQTVPGRRARWSYVEVAELRQRGESAILRAKNVPNVFPSWERIITSTMNPSGNSTESTPGRSRTELIQRVRMAVAASGGAKAPDHRGPTRTGEDL